MIKENEADKVNNGIFSARKKAVKDNRMKKRIDGCETLAEKMTTCPTSFPEKMWEMFVLL